MKGKVEADGVLLCDQQVQLFLEPVLFDDGFLGLVGLELGPVVEDGGVFGSPAVMLEGGEDGLERFGKIKPDQRDDVRIIEDDSRFWRIYGAERNARVDLGAGRIVKTGVQVRR